MNSLIAHTSLFLQLNPAEFVFPVSWLGYISGVCIVVLAYWAVFRFVVFIRDRIQ